MTLNRVGAGGRGRGGRGGMLGTEFDETLGKVAIPDVMNIKVRMFR